MLRPEIEGNRYRFSHNCHLLVFDQRIEENLDVKSDSDAEPHRRGSEFEDKMRPEIAKAIGSLRAVSMHLRNQSGNIYPGTPFASLRADSGLISSDGDGDEQKTAAINMPKPTDSRLPNLFRNIASAKNLSAPPRRTPLEDLEMPLIQTRESKESETELAWMPHNGQEQFSKEEIIPLDNAARRQSALTKSVTASKMAKMGDLSASPPQAYVSSVPSPYQSPAPSAPGSFALSRSVMGSSRFLDLCQKRDGLLHRRSSKGNKKKKKKKQVKKQKKQTINFSLLYELVMSHVVLR